MVIIFIFKGSYFSWVPLLIFYVLSQGAHENLPDLLGMQEDKLRF